MGHLPRPLLRFGRSAACCLALSALASLPTTAKATSGGPSGLGSFCLEPGGKRIFLLESDGGESGCYDRLVSLELPGLERRVEAECSEQGTNAPPGNCVPLQPVDASAAGLEVQTSGGKLDASSYRVALGGVVDPWMLRLTCPATVTLRGAARLRRVVPVCCGRGDAELWGHALPDGRVLLVLRATTNCTETLYTRDEVLGLTAPLRARPRPAGEPGPLRIRLPQEQLDSAELYHRIGLEALRAGQHANALTYFEWSMSGPGQTPPPRPSVLADLAAAASRVGKPEQALDALARLLSYKGGRAQHLRRVQSDPAFDPLRARQEFKDLLDPARCCRVVREQNGDPVRTRVEVEYREGQEHLLDRERWDRGVKVEEWDADTGQLREWHLSGQPRRAGRLVGGKQEGTWTAWNPLGVKESETTFRSGTKDGAEIEYDDYGQLEAARYFREGKLDGPQVDLVAGQLQVQVYREGQLQGPSAFFGTQASFQQLENGAIEGRSLEWDTASRRLTSEKSYERSRIVRECRYSSAAEPRCCVAIEYFPGPPAPGRTEAYASSNGRCCDRRPQGTWRFWDRPGAPAREAPPDPGICERLQTVLPDVGRRGGAP